jgi:hypothetical protein
MKSPRPRLHLKDDDFRALRHMAIDTDRTVGDLVAEAIQLLFKHHNYVWGQTKPEKTTTPASCGSTPKKGVRPIGRPRRALNTPPEGIEVERVRLGLSKREHAKKIGIPIATYLAAVQRESVTPVVTEKPNKAPVTEKPNKAPVTGISLETFAKRRGVPVSQIVKEGPDAPLKIRSKTTGRCLTTKGEWADLHRRTIVLTTAQEAEEFVKSVFGELSGTSDVEIVPVYAN